MTLQPLHRVTFSECQTFALTIPARNPDHALLRAQLLSQRHGDIMFEETGGATEDWNAVPLLIDSPHAAATARASLIRLRDLRIKYLVAHSPRYFPLLSKCLSAHIADLHLRDTEQHPLI
jgi:hypothetical protein